MNWSKLEGKKVMMIGCSDTEPVLIGKIVGCDPDIGICIADVDKVKPWFIVPGVAAPTCRKWTDKEARLINMELEAIFKQLQSGVFSKYVDEKDEERIYGRVRGMEGVNVQCPFTM